MDVVIQKAISIGCIRLSTVNSNPLVFHCVPGAGKSTLIRDLINEDSRFLAYTFGVADKSSLVARIRDHSEYVKEEAKDKIVIVDEYLEGDFEALGPRIVFGDPCQSSITSRVLKPNFILSETKRFGRQTCNLLNILDYNISSSKEDKVTIGGIFDLEPAGQVIAFEPEVKNLLRAHSCDFLDICQIRGKTFKTVTFITAVEWPTAGQEHWFYQALTRHTEEILILSPNASFPTP
ncbi:triple gene block protein 1 [Birch carlavirus]|uniref:Triple gene block protein 1 n=1 Tax=Birch carlavirus TaxID=2248769 RepID=A0AAE5YGG5_9VIRU|nr:triple gene block protein 1 [Birch carlavirus]QBJ27539.1 triple gene block protein 1 [Birch carlavirus]